MSQLPNSTPNKEGEEDQEYEEEEEDDEDEEEEQEVVRHGKSTKKATVAAVPFATPSTEQAKSARKSSGKKLPASTPTVNNPGTTLVTALATGSNGKSGSGTKGKRTPSFSSEVPTVTFSTPVPSNPIAVSSSNGKASKGGKSSSKR